MPTGLATFRDEYNTWNYHLVPVHSFTKGKENFLSHSPNCQLLGLPSKLVIYLHETNSTFRSQLRGMDDQWWRSNNMRSDFSVLDEPAQAAVPGPRAEMELLLCCARTTVDPKTLERLKTLLRQDIDWHRVISTADSHGVLPLLYRSLSRISPDAVPKVIFDQLREGFQSNAQHSLFLTAELFKLLDLFAVHEINAIPFKGPVLAASVYRDLSLRPFSDLDLLLNRNDLLKAGGLLASLGYYQPSDDGVTSEQSLDPEDVAYVGPKFYTFVHQDHGTRVDLQWRVTQRFFSFSPENPLLGRGGAERQRSLSAGVGLFPRSKTPLKSPLIQGETVFSSNVVPQRGMKNSLEESHGRGRLVPVVVAGRPVLTFAPMDLLLILCAHGAKHQWEKMKWICDVAELVRTEKERVDWRKLRQEASRQGVGRMLSLGLVLARDLLGAELPVEVSKAVERDFGRGSVVSRIESRLLNESMEPFGDFELVIFYLRTMDRWQDRVRFCFSYLSQCLRDLATPTSKEREFFFLPAPFSFLYFFFRPLRLTVKYLGLALRRLSRGKRSGPANDWPDSKHKHRRCDPA
jgi:putative nucleotidyltransferase-like protein